MSATRRPKSQEQMIDATLHLHVYGDQITFGYLSDEVVEGVQQYEGGDITLSRKQLLAIVDAVDPLRAAAPEMLAALHAALARLEGMFRGVPDRFCDGISQTNDTIRAVLAKVEG